MADPCEFSIRRTLVGQTPVIRIEAKDGPKLLARIDLTPTDFMDALVDGEDAVTAAIELGKP